MTIPDFSRIALMASDSSILEEKASDDAGNSAESSVPSSEKISAESQAAPNHRAASDGDAAFDNPTSDNPASANSLTPPSSPSSNSQTSANNIWQTPEGIPIQPAYGPGDLTDLDRCLGNLGR